MNNLILVIPAHNPRPELPSIISSIRDRLQGIVVVNDGSDPEYERIFQECGRNAWVLTHSRNRGMGAALKTGFRFALDDLHADGIVAADADGQHAPEDILSVASALRRSPESVVIGVRDFDGAPFLNRAGNMLFRWVHRLCMGWELTDTQTGLRAWPRDAAIRNLEPKPDGMDYQQECLVRITERVIQVPIRTIYIDGNKGSHQRPIRNSLLILLVFLRHIWNRRSKERSSLFPLPQQSE